MFNNNLKGVFGHHLVMKLSHSVPIRVETTNPSFSLFFTQTDLLSYSKIGSTRNGLVITKEW